MDESTERAVWARVTGRRGPEQTLLQQAEALETQLRLLNCRMQGTRLRSCVAGIREIARELRVASYLETGERPAKPEQPDAPLPRDCAAALRELCLETAKLESALRVSDLTALADTARSVGETLRELLRSVL